MTRALDLARTHALLVGVLFAGLLLRVMSMIAYPPALFFGDSWGYIVGAFSGHPVAISNGRPSGYAALIRLLTLPGRDFVQLTAIQHLAGLATGLIVYLVLIKAGTSRMLAALAAALILLDGYAIALEQHVMAEAFFTPTLLVAAVLLARSNGLRSAAISGLLLAAATLQRSEALFAIFPFAAYLIWTRVGWRMAAAFVVALALPLLGYGAAFDHKYGSFGLTQSFGWTMYGRVAAFADCSGAGIAPAARPLCETAAKRKSHRDAPTWYIFSPDSPAQKLFGTGERSAQLQARSNSVLGSFARKIILHQPLDYLKAAGTDLKNYFLPGKTPFGDVTSATSLPTTPAQEMIVEDVRKRFLPSVHPRVQSPSQLMRRYRTVTHVPRPVLALLLVAAVIGLFKAESHRREILLFAGTGVALLIGTAATAGFGIRYLIPVVPFLALGGVLALTGFRRPAALRG